MATTPNASSSAPAAGYFQFGIPPGGSLLERINAFENDPVLRSLWPKGYPEICDEEIEIGESTLHTRTCEILAYGLEFHFVDQGTFRVFRNLNLYYSDEKPSLFVASDSMVVETSEPLPAELTSYGIGQDGPVPLLMAEVLSPRTCQKGDLEAKPVLFKALGIREYIVIDVSGDLLAKRLVLMRRQKDGSWTEAQDADGGVTSDLGFRLIVDADGQLRVIDAKTGHPYPRPSEALAAEARWTAEAEARRLAEDRNRALEEELARLRGTDPKPNGPAPQL
jgi:Uma2 family endonuclease